ncbi:ATPase, T2SS/T4P/T4SS family [Thalassospira lohafexi]|uniref:Type II/IV secretion system protein n=1 Tax=Thalassospira lohafexi TaxID=744227 RepID=A0A2N3L0G5_9PROT|nr:ATPase, T2SS/T4P/T4SS family [Thalassospira lohafexi]PKR56309.1 type II/IV secretion system protein [Thalassospira lohafexi]
MNALSPNPLFEKILGPLASYYGDLSTVEIRMNRPHRVVTERRGEGKREIEDPALTLAAIERIAISLANQRGLKFNPDDTPKLSCVLPGNHRCEILVGASVRSHLSLAIRCKHPFTPTWEQAGVTPTIRDYLIDKVAGDANMIISGATNTGKTTLLNMLLATVDPARRVLAIEDTPELHIEQFWDGNGLIAAREAGTGSGMVGWREIYDHLMRITPDHILFGEISTQNAFAALAALNSGVTGFMCTIHAESPWQAIHRKFDQNIAWAGETMPRVPEFLAELVDVVVQIKRNADGWRRITDIWEPRNDRYVLQDGKEMLS